MRLYHPLIREDILQRDLPIKICTGPGLERGLCLVRPGHCRKKGGALSNGPTARIKTISNGLARLIKKVKGPGRLKNEMISQAQYNKFKRIKLRQ